METMEIEAEVYAGLTGKSELTSVLAKGADSVFHLQAPSDNQTKYPCIVYSPISDVPALTGDDKEVAHRVTIRIHIITLTGDFGAIYRQIHNVMEALGFARVQTTPYAEDDKKILVCDYRIGVDSAWQRSD